METWVLLIFIYISGGLSGGPALTSVPGYLSKDACHDAGDALLDTQDERARNSIGFVCFPGPRR